MGSRFVEEKVGAEWKFEMRIWVALFEQGALRILVLPFSGSSLFIVQTAEVLFRRY